MKRRDFLKAAAGAGTLAALGASPLPATAKTQPSWSRLPRWRGFNLMEKFMVASEGPFREADFDIIKEWGFDFVRLPMDYRCWTDPAEPYVLKEKTLREIDQAVKYGRDRGIHVNLCFHRAPGYTVAQPPEDLNLWKDEEARKRFAHHWATFAKRYKGIASRDLSFDLVNEPANTDAASYVKAATAAVTAIRAEDANRLIIADGLDWGLTPVPDLIPLKVAQSTRGYEPFRLTHYKASWASGSDTWPVPTWPLQGDPVFDKARFKRERIDPWKALQKQGVGVHVGEWGAFQYTPHDVTLAWMKDLLSLWKEAGWGWAVWGLHGGFGPLNSNRADVNYEDFRGQKLDRKMLELLRKY